MTCSSWSRCARTAWFRPACSARSATRFPRPSATAPTRRSSTRRTCASASSACDRRPVLLMSQARHVEIIHLDLAELAALAVAGSDPDLRALWQQRRDQLARDPACASWLTGLVRDPATSVIVGHAGFHGVPDARGMVEIGYEIEPAFRRRGYARGVISALLARAEREPAVRIVRASVSPTNAASLALIAQYGFVQVGEQVDELDGLELVFERVVAKR